MKEKRPGNIKGRGAADAGKQCWWKTKEEKASPTVMIEPVMLIGAILFEGR